MADDSQVAIPSGASRRVARLCRDSALPAIAAQLFRAKKITLMIDQMFKKEPGSRIRTAFHQDEPYFHAEGEQCASFWIPAERVDVENGVMGYVPGSHRWETCRPNLVISNEPIPGSEGKVLPDIESDESGFGVVYFKAAAPPDSTTSAALEDGDELDSVEFPVVWTEP